MASSAAEVERANQSGAAALAAFEETEKRSARAKRELAQSQKIIAAAVERGALSEADAADRLAAAQERYDRTLTQTTDQKRRSAAAQDEMTRSIVSTQSSIDRLEASLDKGFAAQRRYETAVDRVNAAVERGRITQDRGAELISLAQTKYLGAASATAALGAATAAAATQGRNFGAVAQQAGYQIGDFASQVASGGSAVTAFVQQGSQMLGMFGMFGAVAGAALAIGGVAYQMWAARDAAKGATDEVSALTAEIKRLNEESAKRGAGNPAIRTNVRLEDLMSERARLVSMLPGTAGIAGADEMTAFIEAQAAAEVARIQGQIDAIDKLIREYDRLAIEQEQADVNTANLKRRGEEFEEQKRREAEAIREAARALQEEERVRQRFLSDVTALENALDPAAAATRRWADQQALLLKALDEGVLGLERYNELIAASDAAYRRATEQTVQVTEVQIRATREADSVARDLGLTFQSAFEDAIVRGEKLRGVLGGIAQDIARIIVRQTVTTPLAGLATSALSGLGGLISGLLSGPGDIRGPGGSTSVPFGGPRAMGGPVSGGTAYLVGEQGPELFMPGSSGRIIPNGQTGGVTVNQTIQISAGVAQTVRAEIAALMPAIKRQTVDAVADARMRGGSFAAAMGT